MLFLLRKFRYLKAKYQLKMSDQREMRSSISWCSLVYKRLPGKNQETDGHFSYKSLKTDSEVSETG